MPDQFELKTSNWPRPRTFPNIYKFLTEHTFYLCLVLSDSTFHSLFFLCLGQHWCHVQPILMVQNWSRVLIKAWVILRVTWNCGIPQKKLAKIDKQTSLLPKKSCLSTSTREVITLLVYQHSFFKLRTMNLYWRPQNTAEPVTLWSQNQQSI